MGEELGIKKWRSTSDHQAPSGVVLETKIDDERGSRNHALLRRDGRLWWLEDGGMYVYYTPTHWRYPQATRGARDRF